MMMHRCRSGGLGFRSFRLEQSIKRGGDLKTAALEDDYDSKQTERRPIVDARIRAHFAFCCYDKCTLVGGDDEGVEEAHIRHCD